MRGSELLDFFNRNVLLQTLLTCLSHYRGAGKPKLLNSWAGAFGKPKLSNSWWAGAGLGNRNYLVLALPVTSQVDLELGICFEVRLGRTFFLIEMFCCKLY